MILMTTSAQHKRTHVQIFGVTEMALQKCMCKVQRSGIAGIICKGKILGNYLLDVELLLIDETYNPMFLKSYPFLACVSLLFPQDLIKSLAPGNLCIIPYRIIAPHFIQLIQPLFQNLRPFRRIRLILSIIA